MSKALRNPTKTTDKLAEDFGVGGKTVNGQISDSAGAAKTPQEIKAEALAFADELYKKVILTPQFVALNPDARYKSFMETYPNFMRTYVTVAQRMIVYLQYNSKAMSKFLDKMIAENAKPRSADPKARAGAFEERYLLHAEYIRHLYIEGCKASGKHYSVKRANELRDNERKMLKDHMETLKKQEQEAKNAFEDEAELNKTQRKKELLEFITRHREDQMQLPFDDLPSANIELDEEDLRLRAELLGETAVVDDQLEDNLAISASSAAAATVTPMVDIQELRQQYTLAMIRVAELESELSWKECKLERLEHYYELAKQRAQELERNSWLIGTAARPPMVESMVEAKSGSIKTSGGKHKKHHR